jgi:hypothetical protein
MPGPRITIEGRYDQVRQLGQRLIQPEGGLRPWRKVSTFWQGDLLAENFAPLGMADGRPRQILIKLEDYCRACQYAQTCPGYAVEDNARACADVEVSGLRRQIETGANPIHFTYQPPVYGEEDLTYA